MGRCLGGNLNHLSSCLVGETSPDGAKVPQMTEQTGHTEVKALDTVNSEEGGCPSTERRQKGEEVGRSGLNPAG